MCIIFLFQEECTCNYSEEADENGLDFNEKSKIRAKLLELQNEIETYQQLNARYSSLCKERDDVSFPCEILLIICNYLIYLFNYYYMIFVQNILNLNFFLLFVSSIFMCYT